MPSLFRPAPRVNGRRRRAMHRVLTAGGVRYVVLDGRGEIETAASVPISRMSEGGLAEATVPRYGRGFLAFLDGVPHAATATAPGAYTPWSPPPDVIELFKDCVRALGGTLEESTTEKGVYHVAVEDEDRHDAVVAAICGVYHFYDAAVKAGTYKWPNPFEIPFEQRVPRTVPGAWGGLKILPRFRFRIPRGEASPLRTDPSDRVLDIVPALIAAGVLGVDAETRMRLATEVALGLDRVFPPDVLLEWLRDDEDDEVTPLAFMSRGATELRAMRAAAAARSA